MRSFDVPTRMRFAIALPLAAIALAAGPVAHHWSQVASMKQGRSFHTLTALPDGRVLAVGGHPVQGTHMTAEVFDPLSGRWTYTTPAIRQHTQHRAVLLDDGRVAVIGGEVAPRSIELYDAAVNRWTEAGVLLDGRFDHTATKLQDGRVLVVGGWDTAASKPLASAEIFDPRAIATVRTGSLAIARDWHEAVLLPGGEVLVAGGESTAAVLSSAEIYDVAHETWRATASMGDARTKFGMTVVGGAARPVVLAAGGRGVGGRFAVATAETWDPAACAWSRVADMNVARTEFPMVALGDGTVLVAGGEDNEVFFDGVERFDAARGAWTVLPASIPERGAELAMVLMADGRVLVSGGTHNDHYNGSSNVAAVLRP